jgi:hypothetical protein
LGTSKFLEDGFDELPAVPMHLDRIVRLFTEKLGYQRVLTELGNNGLNALSDQIRTIVNSWCSQEDRTAEDIIVFYYTGHGYVDVHGDHYLWTCNAVLRDLQGTAIETANLGKWLLTSSPNRPQNIWVILDTCYAGQGSGAAAAVVSRLKQSPLLDEQSGFWVFAAASVYDEAEQHIFTQAFAESIDTLGRSQKSQAYLNPLNIKDEINQWLECHGHVQRVQADIVGNISKPFFICNPYSNCTKHKGATRSSVPLEPVMNLTEELAAFEKIAAGQDTQTQLILVSGSSGMGKTHLLNRYKYIADAKNLAVLDFNLGPQISIEQCIDHIVSWFGYQHFPSYDAFQSGRSAEPLTRATEAEWYRNLTRKFFIDLSNFNKASPLIIFFDQYEKADIAFKSWLTQVFLPNLSTRYPIIVVIAGQEKIEPPPSRRGYYRFLLTGLKVDWFFHLAESYKVNIDAQRIHDFHEILHGRPKEFVDYVKARSIPGVRDE